MARAKSIVFAFLVISSIFLCLNTVSAAEEGYVDEEAQNVAVSFSGIDQIVADVYIVDVEFWWWGVLIHLIVAMILFLMFYSFLAKMGSSFDDRLNKVVSAIIAFSLSGIAVIKSGIVNYIVGAWWVVFILMGILIVLGFIVWMFGKFRTVGGEAASEWGRHQWWTSKPKEERESLGQGVRRRKEKADDIRTRQDAKKGEALTKEGLKETKKDSDRRKKERKRTRVLEKLTLKEEKDLAKLEGYVSKLEKELPSGRIQKVLKYIKDSVILIQQNIRNETAKGIAVKKLQTQLSELNRYLRQEFSMIDDIIKEQKGLAEEIKKYEEAEFYQEYIKRLNEDKSSKREDVIGNILAKEVLVWQDMEKTELDNYKNKERDILEEKLKGELPDPKAIAFLKRTLKRTKHGRALLKKANERYLLMKTVDAQYNTLVQQIRMRIKELHSVADKLETETERAKQMSAKAKAYTKRLMFHIRNGKFAETISVVNTLNGIVNRLILTEAEIKKIIKFLDDREKNKLLLLHKASNLEHQLSKHNKILYMTFASLKKAAKGVEVDTILGDKSEDQQDKKKKEKKKKKKAKKKKKGKHGKHIDEQEIMGR